LQVPYWIAFAAGMLSEFIADYFTRSPPKAPLTGVRLARHPMFFDSDKAVKELGFPQSSLRQALVDEIKWLVDEGLVTRRVSFLQQKIQEK
ncbi:MAG: hypothetical protein H0V39_02130, partial [Nitrosomonas sp.]|nr:hypothetical protein [Nitrosomonas sp.]